jgi:hypothetical protein
MVTYAVQSSAVERYGMGFILETCPICAEGHLVLDEKLSRLAGIPRIRRVVRCNNCRSVLREVGRRRWRYAVDPLNTALFEQWNGKTIKDRELASLPPSGAGFSSVPRYLDEENRG